MSKKKSSTDVAHADLHQDEEMHVTRTTPQGTQEAGVDKGHELRDILIRPTMSWFVGLLIVTLLIIGAMWGLMSMLAGADRVVKDEVSSPLYVTEPTVRLPELLPNPAQGMNNQKLPWDHMDDFREAENKELKKHGLTDAQGYPALPMRAVQQVMSEPAAGAASLSGASALAGDEQMPSDSTGGQAKAVSVLTK